MAKLSSANLPDWLAQWAMNRGAIEDPSVLSPSPSLSFDEIQRRRILREREVDKLIDHWTGSDTLDPLPPSSSVVSSDQGFFDSLGKMGSNVFSNVLSGASGLFSKLGPSITGPVETARKNINDPYSTLGENIASSLIPVGMQFMGPLAGGLGVLGGLFQGAGGHHDFNPNIDTGLFYDPSTTRVSWESVGPMTGGVQYGDLNATNIFGDIAGRSPGTWVKTPFGYTTVGNLQNVMGSGMFQDVDPLEALNENNFRDSGFRQDAPWILQDFGQGDHNVTNEQALAQYNFDRTGAIQNEAGAIADRVNKEAGYTKVGYNEQQDIADGLAAAAARGEPEDWNVPSLSPEELYYMDLGDEFDQADADIGIDEDFGSVDDWSDW